MSRNFVHTAPVRAEPQVGEVYTAVRLHKGETEPRKIVLTQVRIYSVCANILSNPDGTWPSRYRKTAMTKLSLAEGYKLDPPE